MKTRIISAVTAMTLAGICLTALAFSGSGAPTYSTPADITPPAEYVPPEPSVAEGFWVSERDGLIAVYHNADRAEPVEVTDIPVRVLRLSDQELLREGVYFRDYMDVVHFLEDFGP